MMHFEVVASVPRLHLTPLALIKIEGGRVIVDADDEHEKRVRLVCEPYQAVRVVTADCFTLPSALAITIGTIVEVHDSEWLADLSIALKRNDHTATFMQKARHFLLPLQDEFLEIVAWNIRYEPTK